MTAIPKPPRYDKKADQKNVRLTIELDKGVCQWCLFHKGISKRGSYPHHIFGRRRRWDIDAIITLCINCHSDTHTARQEDGETVITKGKLIALMEEKVTPARKLRAVRLEIEI